MIPRWQRWVLILSCLAALLALALIVWSLLDPRPIPVIVAMSVAQGLGTASLLGYLLVVVLDLRRAKVIGADEEPPK